MQPARGSVGVPRPKRKCTRMRYAPSIVAGLLALTTALPAIAQTRCAPRGVMVERLADHYGETFAGGGLQSDVAVFEVWTSRTDGTWTILMTRADGVSCVMAAGTDWLKAAAAEAPGMPS